MKTLLASISSALMLTATLAPVTVAHAESENSAQILKGAGCSIVFGTPEGVVSGSAPDSFMRVVTSSGNVTAICRLQQTSGPELTRAFTSKAGRCFTGAGFTTDVTIIANPSGMIMLVCKIKGND